MDQDAPSTLRVLTRPRMLALHALGATAIGVTLGLGLWQLESWQESRIDHAAEVAQLDAVPVDDLIGPDDPFPRDGVGRPVTMSGQWLPESTVLVDKRLHDDELGAWVVTPFAVCESDCTDASALPVVVGWVPSVAQSPDPPTGAATLTGWLQPPEPAGEPDEDPTDDVLTAVRIPEILQRVDRDLYGAYVILDRPAAVRGAEISAVSPDFWPDPPPLSGLRNFLYGLEWWVFAGFAAFLWYRWSRDELTAARTRAQRDAEGGPDGATRAEDDGDGGGGTTAGTGGAARIRSST